MNKNGIIIRLEEKRDYWKSENLVRECFWNVYRPGCLEHYVLNQLRNNDVFIPGLDFVMELDGKIIGHNNFAKAVIQADDGRAIEVLTMGPLCIQPELHGKGYGRMLLDYSLEKAAEAGYGAVLIEGDYGFYCGSGFACSEDFGIRYHGLPEGEDSSFFLCRELRQGFLNGVTGEYSTPDAYLVDEAEAELFDKTFPEKTRLRLPGQIFG